MDHHVISPLDTTAIELARWSALRFATAGACMSRLLNDLMIRAQAKFSAEKDLNSSLEIVFS